MWLQIEFELVDSFLCGEWTHNGYFRAKGWGFLPNSSSGKAGRHENGVAVSLRADEYLSSVVRPTWLGTTT